MKATLYTFFLLAIGASAMDSEPSDSRSSSSLRGSSSVLSLRDFIENYKEDKVGSINVKGEAGCAATGSLCRIFSNDCCTGRCLPRTQISREGRCVSDDDDDLFPEVAYENFNFVKEKETLKCRNRGAACRSDSECCNGPCVDINRRLKVCDT